MGTENILASSSNDDALTGVVGTTPNPTTALVPYGVTKPAQFTTAIRTGTTPQIGISKQGSMLLAIAKTPVVQQQQARNASGSKKQTVLEEESYLDKLEEIIERDFFPGIQEMQKRIDVIDYLLEHGKDPVLPDPEDNADSSQSLSEFLAKNTSEDNQSFAELMEKNNSRIHERSPWLWATSDADGGKYVNGRIIKSIPGGNGSSASKARAPLELVARMTPQIDHENRLRAQQLGWIDERATTVQSWKDTKDSVHNGLMFFKDGHGKGISATTQKNQATKTIQHAQTRFFNPPESTNTTQIKEPVMTRKIIWDSITGVNDDRAAGPPKVNGYGFVTGIAGRQPRAVGPPPSSAPAATRSFSITEPSKREVLHDRLLSRKLETRKREKTNPFGHSNSGSSIGSSTGALTSTTSITKPSRQSRLTGSTKSNNNKSVMLSPAGSHLLSTLNSKRAATSTAGNLARPELVGKTFSTPRYKPRFNNK
jgi:hypothetical protein